jgi:hypothetical protein
LAKSNLNTSSTSPDIEAIEMLDATTMQNPTPPPTPATSDEKTQSPPDQGGNTTRPYQATVEDEQDEQSSATLSSTPNSNDSRPRLQPKSPKDCHREAPGLYVRPNYASEVVIEEFNDPNDPMPKGYWGTWRGYRMGYSTVEDYCPCGLGGGHFLVCGHTVISKEPCGANCKTAQHEHEAFKCEQCNEIVQDIFENKLTQEEKDKIKLFHKKNDALYLALCVEAVTKHIPIAKGNIAETVLSFVMENYGRASLAYRTVEDPNEPNTLADTFRDFHESGQRKTREIMAQYNLGSLNTHEKRKDVDDTADTQNDTQENAQEAANNTFPQPPDVASPAT